GFRGEALAAISHISYPKSNVVPMAANDGTVITVENLFYNLVMRKNALNSYSHEYNLILDLLTKYAVNNSNKAAFSLKKFGDNCDLNTNIENKCIENIRGLYGANIANNLVELSFEDSNRLKFSMTGFTSNQNIHQKSFVFILFINSRLVECSSLKKAIDLVYSNYLLKSCHPFVYLDIKIDPKNVDVNVHPTKNEVHFLHEQEICEKVVQIIESKLTDGRETRRLNTEPNPLINASFSQISMASVDESPKRNTNEKCVQMNSKSPKVSHTETTPKRPHKQIRTDSKDRKIDEYLLNAKKMNKSRRDLKLNSVSSLRQKVSEESDSRLQEMICNSSYVGCADETFVLFQFETQLLLVNAYNLNIELFYQLFLVDFGNFAKIRFRKPLLISDLVKPYIEELNKSIDSDTQSSQTLDVTQIETILMGKSEMLSDYFSLDISADRQLISLPIILEGFIPNFAFLPQFLYSLAKDVNWDKEKECFESIGKVLAKFYAKPPNKFNSNLDHQKWAKRAPAILQAMEAIVSVSPPNDNAKYSVRTKGFVLWKASMGV
ncbi:unnamed protein product, partial [Oppiella nova]